ncbi:MAG: 4-(cytidine 5'-diphospho)-2-C-methyl-D-erythritol kinase [Saccharofermentans sp.]|nr:4-(cytidine 5'-diphospho)-2-C-methyl-D-erythritol kinase [Saccharofermentans sp.]
MSTEVYEITANAKINLFLRVTGRLPNGYHKLYSIMQEIGISDDLKITIGEGTSGIEVVCPGRADIEPEHNLCYKAADRFLSKLKKKTLSEGNSFTSPHIRIDLTKNIPSESGMGGGSSDAAAVLVVMQEHFDSPFTEEELAGIAVNVGADVPFFLYGGTCLCEMVGEQITPLNHLEGLPLVIAKPKGGVSTPLCFKMIDSNPLPDFDEGAYAGFVNELDSRIGKGEDVLPFIAANEDLLINDLQAPGIECVPEIATIIQRFKDNGAAYTAMTGSGSAVFAMFPDKESAKSCADKLKEDPDGSKWMLIVTETI